MAYGLKRRHRLPPAARALRGLGDVLPPCSSIVVPPGTVGPFNCDPTAGGVNYSASQSQVSALGQSLQDQIDALAAATNKSGQWFTGISNTTVAALAIGSLFFLLAVRR